MSICGSIEHVFSPANLPMTKDRFFRAFLSVLRLRGVEFIDTRSDVHHVRFARAMDELASLQAEDATLRADLIQPLTPSPFTGRYADFDAALMQAQHGFAGAQNPFYPGMDLSLDTDQAEQQLEALSEAQRVTLDRLAEAYLGGSQASDPSEA